MQIQVKPRGKKGFYIGFTFSSKEEEREVNDVVDALLKDNMIPFLSRLPHSWDLTLRVSKAGKDEALRDLQTVLQSNSRTSKFKVEVLEQKEE